MVTNFESAKEQVKEEYGYVIEMDEEKIYNKIKDIITDPEQLEEKKKYLKEMDMRRYCCRLSQRVSSLCFPLGVL